MTRLRRAIGRTGRACGPSSGSDLLFGAVAEMSEPPAGIQCGVELVEDSGHRVREERVKLREALVAPLAHALISQRSTAARLRISPQTSLNSRIVLVVVRRS